MGNCIKRGSRTHWGGEEWGPALAPPEKSVKPPPASATGAGKGGSLKVKITKRQLEEVIGKMGTNQGLTAQQVLDQLMTWRVEEKVTSPAWKPRLQSIPEWKSFHLR